MATLKNDNKNMFDNPASLRGYALRKGRYSGRDGIYLLTSVTHNRQPIFADWRLGRCVAAAFRRAEEAGHARSLAWVVMPDHFHWLMVLGDLQLAKLMHDVKGSSSSAINRVTGQRGRVWQAGYHDHAVRSEEDIKSLARYVVANPLRAGLVENIGDYCLWDAVWLE